MNTALGIIGHPIGHSLSPVFQQAGLDFCGVNAQYRAYAVAPEELAAFIAGLRRPHIWGINVTVPHKEAVIPLLDEVDSWAAEAGAVNTIVHRNGRLTGYNTDGVGFLRSLQADAAFTPQGRQGLILGAGGAARGVVLALARAGIGSLTIANRTRRRAEALAQLARDSGVTAQAISLPPPAGAGLESMPAAPTSSAEVAALLDAPLPDNSTPGDGLPGSELSVAALTADLIVNCTTIGMTHGPGAGESPLPGQIIPPTALVYDLVYNPPETPLLRAAAWAGGATLGGIGMLVYQGAASFELWLERPAPTTAMLTAAAQAMPT